MSLRLLQKTVGEDPGRASAGAKAALQPNSRGRGGGGGYPSRGGGGGAPPANIGQQVEDFLKENEIDDWAGDRLREAHPKIQQAVLDRGNLLGTRDPSKVLSSRIRQSVENAPELAAGSGASGSSGGGSRVMAPTVVGGFHGSSAQAAHIAATKRNMASTAQSQSDDWKQTSELAKVSKNLGLKAVEERKRKEEEERERKREERRLQRLGQEKQKEEEAQKKLAECEEQALCDSEAHATVKYEAALIVRIAVEFGASGVWMKIAEARTRGAEIPLDAKKVYLLAHPDKCRLPEAADATAILNQQRPPEMTESRTNAGSRSSASLPGSREAVAARVAAKREAAEAKRTDPEDGQDLTFDELVAKYKGVYSEAEIQAYWEEECAVPGAERQVAAEPAAPAAAPPAAPPAAARPAPGPSQKAKQETRPPANDPAPSDTDAVPGLTAWLTSLNLEDHITAAAEWATEEGAVALDEIVENLDEFVEALQLKPGQIARLKQQGAETAPEFAAAAKAANVPAPAVPVPTDQVDEYEPEGTDAFCEARAGHLDVERDFCELSRFDEPPPDTSHAAPRPVVRQTAGKAVAKPSAVSAGPRPQPQQQQQQQQQQPQQTNSQVSAEKRVDPYTGKSITFDEMCKVYDGQYGPMEIQEYWETCKPAANWSRTSRRY